MPEILKLGPLNSDADKVIALRKIEQYLQNFVQSRPTVRLMKASASLTANDRLIRADASAGPLTIQLPLAAFGPYTEPYEIKKIDATPSAVTILPAAGEDIDGGASLVITSQYESYTLLPRTGGYDII